MKDSLVEGELIRIPAECYKIVHKWIDNDGNFIYTKTHIPKNTIATFIIRDTVLESAIRNKSEKMSSLYICAKILIEGRNLCHALIPYHRDFYR